MPRLPIPGGDKGNWGAVLNDYLSVAHNTDGTIKNGAIAESQLDAVARTKLNAIGGTPGSTGPQGPQGPTGPAGQNVPEAYHDPRSNTSGAISDITFGEFIGSYGNAPAYYSNGKITHTPTHGANDAAYIEVSLSNDVGRLGMEVEWSSGQTGSFALLVPESGGWYPAYVVSKDAGIHATITPAGVVSCRRLVGGTLVGGASTQIGPLTGRHSFEVLLDYRRTEVTVLVDGVTTLRFIDAIAFNYLSNRAIFELFAVNGMSDTPGSILAMWSDIEKVIPPSRLGTSIPPVRRGYANNFTPTTIDISLSTSYRNPLAIGELGAYFPPSGRLLCRYRALIQSSTLDSNARVFGSIESSVDQVVAFGGYKGPVTCEAVVAGTPGALVVLTPQMWAENSTGTVTVRVGNTAGSAATISAIPVEELVAW